MCIAYKEFLFIIQNNNYSISLTLSKKNLKRSRLKLKFIIWGAINLFLSNIILHFLIYIDYINIFYVTLIAQSFNFLFGYFAYGIFVFRSNRILEINIFFRYFILSILLWFFNWMGIEFFFELSVPKNLSALITLIPLCIISFFLQKLIIFRK